MVGVVSCQDLGISTLKMLQTKAAKGLIERAEMIVFHIGTNTEDRALKGKEIASIEEMGSASSGLQRRRRSKREAHALELPRMLGGRRQILGRRDMSTQSGRHHAATRANPPTSSHRRRLERGTSFVGGKTKRWKWKRSQGEMTVTYLQLS